MNEDQSVDRRSNYRHFRSIKRCSVLILVEYVNRYCYRDDLIAFRWRMESDIDENFDFQYEENGHLDFHCLAKNVLDNVVDEFVLVAVELDGDDVVDDDSLRSSVNQMRKLWNVKSEKINFVERKTRTKRAEIISISTFLPISLEDCFQEKINQSLMNCERETEKKRTLKKKNKKRNTAQKFSSTQ